MELRHLRYFVAVAEEGSFRRAAEKLRMSQPPLSQQVKDLEREIDASLFERSGRGVRLTHAGSMFLVEARRTLEQAVQAGRTAARAQRGEIGRLSIGFVGSATYEVLPRLLRAFRAEHPEVGLELQTMSTLQQLSAFRERRIQLGILRPPADGDFFTRTIARESLVAAMPVDHPHAQRNPLSLSDFTGEDFILWPRDHAPHTLDRILSLCQEAGFSPNVVQQSAELQTITGLVAAGVGVSLLIGNPEHLLRYEGVVYRTIEAPLAYWELSVAWRKDEPSPVVQAFLEILDSHIIAR